MHYWIIGIFLLLVQNVQGEAPDHIRKQLEAAAIATGTNYITARNNLVNLGSNSIPQLIKISANTNEFWKLRLMAGIVAERIQHGQNIVDLISKDWKSDPEYNKNWDKKHEGALPSMGPLAVKRYKEAALWFYYVEVIWKETEEHSQSFSKRESSWRGISRQACKDSPVYNLLVKALEERIRNDIGFKEYERWGEWHFIVDNQTNNVLPVILDLLPLIPINDSQREDQMFKILKNMAQPEDIPLIEKYFKDKDMDVPLMLQEPLKKLRTRRDEKDVSRSSKPSTKEVVAPSSNKIEEVKSEPKKDGN